MRLAVRLPGVRLRIPVINSHADILLKHGGRSDWQEGKMKEVKGKRGWEGRGGKVQA